jgi:hypothetical protein
VLHRAQEQSAQAARLHLLAGRLELWWLAPLVLAAQLHSLVDLQAQAVRQLLLLRLVVRLLSPLVSVVPLQLGLPEQVGP